MDRAIIYTDGSCGHKKDGGWACIIATPHAKIELAGCEEDTTSNRMEMIAAIRGLEYLKEPHMVFLASDSAYMLNVLKNQWYVEWFSSGMNRKNLDLWRIMANLALFHTIETIKVQGHGNDLTNILVDEMAVEARLRKVAYTNVISSYS